MGNFLIITVHKQQLASINLYGQNRQPFFFKTISSHIDDIGNTEVIKCGYYNLVLNPDLDYYN